MNFGNFGNYGVGGFGVIVVMLLLAFWPAWRICAKTGHSGALAIGLLVPVVNIFIWLYLAFSQWPIERELERLKGSPGSY
jgi:hypothetical protein